MRHAAETEVGHKLSSSIADSARAQEVATALVQKYDGGAAEKMAFIRDFSREKNTEGTLDTLETVTENGLPAEVTERARRGDAWTSANGVQWKRGGESSGGLSGYVSATEADITAILGEPSYRDDRTWEARDKKGDKTSREWNIQVKNDDGELTGIQIYDYKTDLDGGVYKWHISGGENAVGAVENILRKQAGANSEESASTSKSISNKPAQLKGPDRKSAQFLRRFRNARFDGKPDGIMVVEGEDGSVWATDTYRMHKLEPSEVDFLKRAAGTHTLSGKYTVGLTGIPVRTGDTTTSPRFVTQIIDRERNGTATMSNHAEASPNDPKLLLRTVTSTNGNTVHLNERFVTQAKKDGTVNFITTGNPDKESTSPVLGLDKDGEVISIIMPTRLVP
jgi:hypothetical protein